MSWGILEVDSMRNTKVTLMWIEDQGELILCDTGFPWSVPEIETKLQSQNFDLSRISKIIITHHDCDHMGSLSTLKEKYPKIEVISSSVQKPYIEGYKKSLRIEQAQRVNQTLQGEDLKQGEAFVEFLSSIKPCTVDKDVEVNFEKISNSIYGIFSPGHMPGHLSILYVDEKGQRILYAGDSLVVENGEIQIANPHYTLDLEAAKQSILDIKEYQVDVIVASHGGIIDGDINNKIENLEL